MFKRMTAIILLLVLQSFLFAEGNKTGDDTTGNTVRFKLAPNALVPFGGVLVGTDMGFGIEVGIVIPAIPELTIESSLTFERFIKFEGSNPGIKGSFFYLGLRIYPQPEVTPFYFGGGISLDSYVIPHFSDDRDYGYLSGVVLLGTNHEIVKNLILDINGSARFDGEMSNLRLNIGVIYKLNL